MADAGGVSRVSEGHVRSLRRRVQVRPSRQELPGGERASHRLL